MPINPISGIGSANFAGASAASFKTAGAAKFKQVMHPPKAEGKQATGAPAVHSNQPIVTIGKAKATAAPPVQKTAPAEKTTHSTSTQILDRVSAAQHRMDEILHLAESGKSFSPAELLSLQAHVFQASQELDLAGKVVEKATGGIKQVLQTQV